MRTTTREADAPQQNGAAEQAIRWLKARARILLRQAGAGSELWPCAMATAATQQRAQQLGLKSKLAAPFGAKCSVRLKFFHKMKGDIYKAPRLKPSFDFVGEGVACAVPSGSVGRTQLHWTPQPFAIGFTGCGCASLFHLLDFDLCSRNNHVFPVISWASEETCVCS